jgi:hypothetical protein
MFPKSSKMFRIGDSKTERVRTLFSSITKIHFTVQSVRLESVTCNSRRNSLCIISQSDVETSLASLESHGHLAVGNGGFCNCHIYRKLWLVFSVNRFNAD